MDAYHGAKPADPVRKATLTTKPRAARAAGWTTATLRSRRMRAWVSAALLGALTISGCTPIREYKENGYKVGPNYFKPQAAVQDQWIDANDKRVSSDSVDMSHWWSIFNDPVLNSLVAESVEQNLTLREAGFRILQARAQRNIQVGSLFPQTQQLEGNYTRAQISKANTNTSFIPQRFLSQYQVGFNLSWEIDFWGRYRRSVEAAEAELDATVEGYDAVLVTLQGDIAQTYIEIRTTQRQLELVRANVKLQEQTLELTAARADAGLTSELDLAQAQSNVAQTEALIPQIEADLRYATNRLCVLLGAPPTQVLDRLGSAPIPRGPERISVGIPAELLTRRPDVKRAERTLAAQSARIGIATTDLYPRIAVTGFIGSSAATFNNLLTNESFYGNIGPAYQWNILNYGRIKNNIRLQEARFQELIATYQQTVLQAEQEAENGLVRFLKAQERATALRQSVQASEKAVELALTQYKGGLVDFNRIALLQLNLVQQQDLEAQAEGTIAVGLVDLYRALGGGWEYRMNPDAVYVDAVDTPAMQQPSNIGIPVPEPATEPVPVAPAPDAPQSGRFGTSDRNDVAFNGDSL